MNLFSKVSYHSNLSIFSASVKRYVISQCRQFSIKVGKPFRIFSILKKVLQTGLDYINRNRMNFLILTIFMFGFLLVTLMDLQAHSFKYIFIPFFIFMFGFGLLFKQYVFFSQKLQNTKREEYIKFLNDKILNIADEIGSQLSKLKDKEVQLQRQIGKLEQKRLKLNDGSECSPVHSNMYSYQPFNRFLNSNNSYTLKSKWSELLGVSVSSKELSYIAERICLMESLSKGRLAAAIEDVVLRVLVCKSIENKDTVVVEIGSLFGICLSSIFDRLHSSNIESHMIAIDPLDGYYGANRTDPFTGESVEENTFHHNMKLIVPERNYTLLKLLSTDKKAIEHIAKVRCDVLIIDGDHSYQGVKNDFDLYLPFVNSGGLVVN